MNWKRVAELAVLIYENYDKDHKTLADPNDRHGIRFNMMTYVNTINGCVTSCCAFGYAYLKWHDELPKHLQDAHLRFLRFPVDINYRHRAVLFDLDVNADDDLVVDMFESLFATYHPSDPERYVYRTAAFLNKYWRTDIRLNPFNVEEVLEQLKQFMA